MIPRNCTFCGLCCTLAVKVTEKEILTIEQLGKKRDDFTEKDVDGTTLLKRKDGYCTFLSRNGNVAKCTIYDSRPSPCRDFPGTICELKENVVFNNLNNKPASVKEMWNNAPKKDDPLPKEQPEFPKS
jgi:Fe-S-cluster containining protein